MVHRSQVIMFITQCGILKRYTPVRRPGLNWGDKEAKPGAAYRALDLDGSQRKSRLKSCLLSHYMTFNDLSSCQFLHLYVTPKVLVKLKIVNLYEMEIA